VSESIEKRRPVLKRFLIPALLVVLVSALCVAGVIEGYAAPPLSSPVGVTPTPKPRLPPGVVSGVVCDAEGPVAGAAVRVQLTDNQTTTAADGSFTLRRLAAGVPVNITAWAEGYNIGWTSATPGLEPVTITSNPFTPPTTSITNGSHTRVSRAPPVAPRATPPIPSGEPTPTPNPPPTPVF